MIRSLTSVTKNLTNLSSMQYVSYSQLSKQIKLMRYVDPIVINHINFVHPIKGKLISSSKYNTFNNKKINNSLYNKSMHNFSTQKDQQQNPNSNSISSPKQNNSQLQPPQLTLPQLKQKISQYGQQLVKYQKQQKTKTPQYVNLLYQNVMDMGQYLTQLPIDFAMRKSMDDGFFKLQKLMELNKQLIYNQNKKLNQKINPQLLYMRFYRGSINYNLNRFEQSIKQLQIFTDNQLNQKLNSKQINTFKFRAYTQMIMAGHQLVDYSSGKNKQIMRNWHKEVKEIVMNKQLTQQISPSMKYIMLAEAIGMEFSNQKGNYQDAVKTYEYLVDRIDIKNNYELRAVLNIVENLSKADKLNTEKYLPILEKSVENVLNKNNNTSKNQLILMASLILQTTCFHEKHYQKRYQLLDKLTNLFKSELNDLPPYISTLFLLRKCSLTLQLNDANKKQKTEELIRQCLKQAKKMQSIPDAQLWKYFYKSLYEISDYAKVEKFDQKFTGKLKKLDKQVRNCDARLRGRAQQQQKQRQQKPR